jgi:hypothetical protein
MNVVHFYVFKIHSNVLLSTPKSPKWSLGWIQAFWLVLYAFTASMHAVCPAHLPILLLQMPI